MADRLGRKPFKKSPQGRLIGKPGKSQQGEKGAIVLQYLGLVDTAQTCHDRIEKSQDHIGRKIVGIALRNFDIILDDPSESKLVAKTLKKYHSTEVGEMGIDEHET